MTQISEATVQLVKHAGVESSADPHGTGMNDAEMHGKLCQALGFTSKETVNFKIVAA